MTSLVVTVEVKIPFNLALFCGLEGEPPFPPLGPLPLGPLPLGPFPAFPEPFAPFPPLTPLAPFAPLAPLAPSRPFEALPEFCPPYLTCEMVRVITLSAVFWASSTAFILTV